MEAQRKVFIDCGSNQCKVLEYQVRHRKDFEFYAFEPQPELSSIAESLIRKYPDVRIQFYNKAVWTEDVCMDFFLATFWGAHHRGGSTLIKGHTKNASQVDYCSPISVECINFSRWIRENFKKEDYIAIKMDIEGAEYAVLEKMIEEGTIGYLDQLAVEFHWRMSTAISIERHNVLMRKLRRYVTIKEWH